MLMPVAHAQQLDATLFNKVVELMSQQQPDELELKRCEAGIDRCIAGVMPPADMSRCYTARAMARLIRKDGRGALEAARNAAMLRPSQHDTIIQLLTVLRSVGAAEDAGRLADKWRPSSKGDVDLLCAIGEAYLDQYRDEDALAVLQEVTRLSAGRKTELGSFDEDAIEQRIALKHEEGATCEQLAQEVGFVIDFISQHSGILPLRTLQRPVIDGMSMHWLFIDASWERCREIERLAGHHYVRRFDRVGVTVSAVIPSPLDDYFSKKCRKHEEVISWA